ncbi:hypothetical protein K402DRAFT_397316 [Aulographum hederae CBS 113979]|uniref:Endonuclease/exonuclease/phosphatase domain-containing protein n=1 Tax=Aulographum hederae CBS 113979 TaxID=1176131 RepID=A0A6G1GPE1_9PEZI|nr:hypothetical protein K402DRAFT_397316 [Aulographum hederae CBS 113979]
MNEVEKLSLLKEQFSNPIATPQSLPAEFFHPRNQLFHVFSNSEWNAATPTSDGPALLETNFAAVALISWNIDFLKPCGGPRMTSALSYLSQTVLPSIPTSQVKIVMLQEMDFADLDIIKSTPWIQESFFVTDIEGMNWKGSPYGTTTLVDVRVKDRVRSIFRVPFRSRFGRDGLFVDLDLGSTSEPKITRLCNVHLESLVADPPVRPSQLESAAKYMRDPSVSAAALAGDCNAIQPFDETLHSDNGLKDVFLELGGNEHDKAGFTWGYQSPKSQREQFEKSRMDKVMICGDLKPVELERIGLGVCVEDEDFRREMEELQVMGEEAWVTDHAGLKAILEL